MPVARSLYGSLPDGTPVDQIILQHPEGMLLKVITYGGIIRELHVPDREGILQDVVLGLPSLEAYLAGHPWFGAITGRVAGRITGGHFTIDGEAFQLEQNNGPNLLHGGSSALDKQCWNAETGSSDRGEPWVTLHHVSEDGASGFPGKLDIHVTYQLTDAGELKITYAANTTRRTPLSLTHHSYFNLAGDGQGTVTDHLLQILADQYVPAESDGTLTGKVCDVAETPNDAREFVRTGDFLPGLRGQHGENYLIRRESSEDANSLFLVARVEEPASGRVMEVLSTESSLQFYSGVALGEQQWIGKAGEMYVPHSGFCFECQGYPDGVNVPEIEDILLDPEEVYSQTTVYRFGIK